VSFDIACLQADATIGGWQTCSAMDNQYDSNSADSCVEPSVQPSRIYGVLIESLHSTKCYLLAGIEDAKRAGMSTASLESALQLNRMAMLEFLAFLVADAKANT
jgi:hypothetical protein